jgi:hypothetical protein
MFEITGAKCVGYHGSLRNIKDLYWKCVPYCHLGRSPYLNWQTVESLIMRSERALELGTKHSLFLCKLFFFT